MNVDKIMSQKIVAVKMDDSLKTVKEVFDKTHFHHLLVVEGKQLFGIISDRDLLEALSPNLGLGSETEKYLATLNKRAHQIMSRKPISLEPHADIYKAIEIFNRTSISCIPIVNSNFYPIGIVSWRDILKALETMRKNSSF